MWVSYWWARASGTTTNGKNDVEKRQGETKTSRGCSQRGPKIVPDPPNIQKKGWANTNALR